MNLRQLIVLFFDNTVDFQLIQQTLLLATAHGLTAELNLTTHLQQF